MIGKTSQSRGRIQTCIKSIQRSRVPGVVAPSCCRREAPTHPQQSHNAHGMVLTSWLLVGYTVGPSQVLWGPSRTPKPKKKKKKKKRRLGELNTKKYKKQKKNFLKNSKIKFGLVR